MNSGRSITASIERRSVGIPLTIVGNGSVVTVNCVVWGSTLIVARTTSVPQIERSRDQRHHNRQAKRRALIRSSQIDRGRRRTRLRNKERIRSRTSLHDRMPDLRRGRARACGLWFLAQRNLRDHAQQALRCLERQPLHALLPIATRQQHREVRVPTSLIGRGTSGHRRANGHGLTDYLPASRDLKAACQTASMNGLAHGVKSAVAVYTPQAVGSPVLPVRHH